MAIAALCLSSPLKPALAERCSDGIGYMAMVATKQADRPGVATQNCDGGTNDDSEVQLIPWVLDVRIWSEEESVPDDLENEFEEEDEVQDGLKNIERFDQ